MGSALAGDGQVEVGVEKLLGEEDDLAGAGVRATASSGPHISESRHGAPEVGKPGCYHGLTAGVRRTVALVRGRVGAAAPRNSCTELAAGLVSQRLPEGSMEMAPGTEAV